MIIYVVILLLFSLLLVNAYLVIPNYEEGWMMMYGSEQPFINGLLLDVGKFSQSNIIFILVIFAVVAVLLIRSIKQPVDQTD